MAPRGNRARKGGAKVKGVKRVAVAKKGAKVARSAKAATSAARVVFADGEKVPELPAVPPPTQAVEAKREQLVRTRKDEVDLNQHIARTIAQVASINSRGPERETPYSMPGPNSSTQAINYLRDSEIAKEYPGPDPYKNRVSTMRGVYRLPAPTSLPPGARITVPFTARARVGDPRQFTVGVQGPAFAPVWRHE
jgi:hypothetical protein